MMKTFGASNGGGIGGYWGAVRSDGTSTSHGSKSGSIPFMKVVDSQMLAPARNNRRVAMQHIWMYRIRSRRVFIYA